MRGAAAVAAASVAALAACGQGARDRRAAEQALRGYNEAAILAYRTRDLEPLRRFATDAELGRVVVLVDLKTSNRLVLESELLSFELTRVERTAPALLAAETRERWRYRDRPLDPGAPTPPTFVADMRLRYELVRADGGGWRVERARTLENAFLEPPGFQLPKGGHGPAQGGHHARPAER